MKDIPFAKFDSNMKDNNERPVTVGQTRRLMLIVGGLGLAACSTKVVNTILIPEDGNSPKFPTSEIDPTAEATQIPLPKIEPATVQEAQAFLDYENKLTNNALSDRGITTSTMEGAYLPLSSGGGDFLFYAKDKNGFDYIWRTNEKKTEQLNFGELEDGSFILFGKPDENGLITNTYFRWNPNENKDSNEIIVTYSPDGTSNTSINYILTQENPLHGPMKIQAIMAPVETESLLPEGPISELQKTLGDKYKLSQEGDYFVISGIENLKFNKDGTAELVYGGEDLTIAFQAISLDGENLNIGPWQYNKEGEVTMLTAGAPKTVEDAANFPKLAYLEGHAKEKEIDLTIHKYVSMATAETAASEFENIVVDGEKVDLIDSFGWQSSPLLNNPTDGVKGVDIFSPNSQESYDTPMFIAIESGYYNLDIYDNSGKQLQNIVGLPIIVKNPDESIVTTTGLTNPIELQRIIGLVTKEKRYFLYPVLLTDVESGGHNNLLLADQGLQEFVVKSNKELLASDIIEPTMDQLPQRLGTMGFWVFVTW